VLGDIAGLGDGETAMALGIKRGLVRRRITTEVRRYIPDFVEA
jgi:hypothetical protein